MRLTHLIGLSALFGIMTMAHGQESVEPLKPLDRSSPRAALKTFLDSGDKLGAFLQDEYLYSPSREKFSQAIALSDIPVKSLDLTQIPDAARNRAGRAAAVELYETLNRIPLPPWEAIPDGSEMKADATGTTRWVIPDTEIVLVEITNSNGEREYLFSADAIEHAGEYYEKVVGLPYQREVPLENMGAILAKTGGWLIPYSWVLALPEWLQDPMLGQSAWKWIVLVAILGVAILLLRRLFLFSHWRNAEHPVLESLAKLALPVGVLILTPIVFYLTRIQLKLVGDFAITIEVVDTALMFLAGAWVAWRIAPVAAEAVIASPRISPESIDAHLIRIFTRLLGLALATGVLVMGADRLGVHMYGILAGVGVGGLAIALAAQSTIENLIGGLSLFADKPLRVGDVCMYGTEVGKIEAIGIRSTRIRGGDRALTTIPNGMFSKMPIVNLSVRDQLKLKTVLGLRQETTPEQLRHVLTKLRELLLAHPMVTPNTSRVRFIGLGEFSLTVQVSATINTIDWNEYLGVQEDLLLRIIEVINESGSGLAFPSQTLYMARDSGLDSERSAAAEKDVRQWRADQKLPFPDIDPERIEAHRDTLDYPPTGSPEKIPDEDSKL